MIPERYKELYDQGASMLSIRVLMHDTDGRNSLRELVDERFPEADLDEIKEVGGGFSRAVLDGDLEEAWYRADGNNSRILSEIYEEWEIALHMDREKPPSAFTHQNYHSWDEPEHLWEEL